MLNPFRTAVLARTLCYPYEVRTDADYFEDIPDVQLSEEMLEVAEHIVGKKSAEFDPSKFEDRYQSALVELLKQKQAGLPQKSEVPAVAPPRVINLMDALRASIGAETGKKPTAASTRARRSEERRVGEGGRSR